MRTLLRKGEGGQVIVIAALLLPLLLGMTAMAVDVGSYSSDRRNLQNAADAIALAAAKDLPDSNQAMGTANQYAIKNHISPSDMTVTISGGNTAPQVRVVISVNHNFSFIRALGVSSKAVSGTATAGEVSFGGSNGVVPWAVTQATVDAAPDGALITMKYDATGGNLGNFGAIRIDGSGAATYNSDTKYGSNSYVCAATAPQCSTGACPGTYPSVCGETAPSCDGPDCTTETGNMTGPTRTAVDFRMANTSTACDTFTEAFGSPDPSGHYHLAQACNPWLSGQTCPQTPTPCSRRVIIIPVVDDFGNGASTVTLQRFALVYLEGYSGSCTGNSCDILGRFVTADITTNALAGTYDPSAKIHFTKLIE